VFHGSKVRVDWYLLIDFTRRIDFAVMYLSTSINFLIISYCLYKPKGIHKEIKEFIFIVCLLDLIHYLLISRVYFGMVKIFLAIIIYYTIKLVRRYGDN